MNRIIIVCVVVLSCSVCEAQDTIVKKTGEKLIVKLAEVNPFDVRYYRLDNQSGPIITTLKQDIAHIFYANGFKESFELFIPAMKISAFQTSDLSIQTSGQTYYYRGINIEEADMLEVVSKRNDKKLNLMINKVENKRFIQNLCILGGIAVFAAGFYFYASNRPVRGARRSVPAPPLTTSQSQGQTAGKVMMLAGIAGELVGISCKLSRTHQAHLLVDAYNETMHP